MIVTKLMRSQVLCWECMQLRTESMGSKLSRPTYLTGGTLASNSSEARRILMLLTELMLENGSNIERIECNM